SRGGGAPVRLRQPHPRTGGGARRGVLADRRGGRATRAAAGLTRSTHASDAGNVGAMSTTDEFLTSAEKYQANFDKGDLPMPPGRKIAVVACMDARLNPYGLLGLQEGDAHVIRNAGGVVTDDVLRSLAISQRLLGTEEIVLIHHTDCGMLTFRDDDFKAQIETDTGMRPRWSPEAFA